MIAQRTPLQQQQQRSAAACRTTAVRSQRVRVCSVRAVARPNSTSSQKQVKQQDASPLQTVEKLLFKYTRQFIQDGHKMFNRR